MAINCRLKENKKSPVCQAKKLKSPLAKIKKLEEAIGMVIPEFEVRQVGVTKKQLMTLIKRGDVFEPKKGLIRRIT